MGALLHNNLQFRTANTNDTNRNANPASFQKFPGCFVRLTPRFAPRPLSCPFSTLSCLVSRHVLFTRATLSLTWMCITRDVQIFLVCITQPGPDFNAWPSLRTERGTAQLKTNHYPGAPQPGLRQDSVQFSLPSPISNIPRAE